MCNIKSRHKKIFVIIMFTVCMLISTNLFAVSSNDGTDYDGIIDAQFDSNVYKSSEDNTISYLPYVRFSDERAVVDREINKMGAIFSNKNIEVNKAMKEIQVLFASDSIRVNSNMEYGVMFAGSNIVIDSNIDKSLIIFAANDVTITKNATINGDLILFTSNLDIQGRVNGSVLGACENIDITGTIGTDLRVETESLDTSSSDNIKGKIYIVTTNNNIDRTKYPDATIKVITNDVVEEVSIAQIIIDAIIVCIAYSLMYWALQRVRDGSFANNSFDKVTSNPAFLITSGALSLFLIPLVTIILIALCAFKLAGIAVPLMIAYFAFIICFGMLSTFIVGSVLFKYVSQKYSLDNNIITTMAGSFGTFIVLYILARLPVIGNIVTFILVMLSIGIALTVIFKNNTKITGGKMNLEVEGTINEAINESSKNDDTNNV